MRVSSLFLLLGGLGLAVESARAETREVVAGPQYGASGVHELFLGADYRKLWVTPIQVEVLDLKTYASGLTPVRRVGGMQTRSLALKGGDGRAYTFRSLDKDPSAALPADLQGTIATKIIQDQTSGGHPAGMLVAEELLSAAGVLHPKPHLVVMPDDPALGELRAVFANVIGTIEEYSTPGFGGSTAVLSPADAWARFEADPAERPDVRAFLRGRLVDLLIGDWDRHRNQYRWARVPDKTDWQPIPEDRDQAFARYEGVLPWIARSSFPKIVVFGPKYPNLEGLTFNGWEHDRRLLSGLAWSEWEPIVSDLKQRLTDGVIDAAIARLPVPYQTIDGPRMQTALRRRRDHLGDVARHFYGRLSRQVDLRLTDAAEQVDVVHDANGEVEIAVKAAGAEQPYIRRRLKPSETKEVRLHLRGGDDQVVTHGAPRKIQVRAIGGPGADALDDSAGGGTRLYDDAEAHVTPGPGTHHDRRSYTVPPQKYPWDYPRDWGGWTVPVPWVAASPDLGLFAGGGYLWTRYGFRKEPYASEQLIRAGWATTPSRGRVEYRGDFRRANSRTRFDLAARASGIDILKFHGFGNETPLLPGLKNFYKVEQRQYTLAPSVGFGVGPRFTLSLGPEVQLAQTELEPGRFITLTHPYGADEFGQAGVRARLAWDSRDRPKMTERGLYMFVESRTFPEAWDVEKTFSTLHGEASTAVNANHRLILAARVGAKHVFGKYPFHEAAFIGGSDTVRGFDAQRFAGDSAVWGNVELRFFLAHVFVLLPGEVGLFALGDGGRVFLEGEDSDRWHTSVGGGLLFSVLSRQQTLSFAVAHSRERTSFYIRGGASF